MAKKKKNSNYSTEKTRIAQEQKEEQKRKEKIAKTVKLVAICVGGALAFIAILLGILFAVGAFDYVPEATYHASFTLDNGSVLHVELYGNEAPETVEHFIDLCESEYFNGMTVRTLLDGMLTVGSASEGDEDRGITGEFDKAGHDNPIPMTRGYVGLSRGDSYDSGYGQFFILTGDRRDLQGEYALFGRITDMSTVDALIAKLTVEDDGDISESGAPRILSVSLHSAHY